MTVLKVTVDGKEVGLYVDERLHRGIINNVKPKIAKKDFDWVWVVDGGEGSGKSTFAMQLAKVLDSNFCLDRVCMTPAEFTKAILRAKKGECVVFDEAFTGLSSRASLTEINRLLVSLMMEMRQKNLFVIIVMPTFFLLDRYVALFRARGLFHVYLKNGNRGRWVYFNNRKKKLLYILGKKIFSYAKPRTKFYGRFLGKYVVNEAEYRKKKEAALMNKSRTTRSEKYKLQRDLLFWIIFKHYKKTQMEIARLCKTVGFNIDRSSIAKIIEEIGKRVISEQVEKEMQAEDKLVEENGKTEEPQEEQTVDNTHEEELDEMEEFIADT